MKRNIYMSGEHLKEIARKSCEDQQEIINKANQMSALNEKKEKTLTTPSVIFKLLRFPVFLGCCYVIHFYFDDNILLYFVGAVILL